MGREHGKGRILCGNHLAPVSYCLLKVVVILDKR